MKNPLKVLFPILLLNLACVGPGPWQEITEPSVAEIASNFKTPPPEYAATVTWGWNGPMTETVISRDLNALYARGFRAVTIEAGYGMDNAPYLSPGWFELIKYAVEQARERGMRVWIIDEGKYPSGFAGGKFSRERPDLCMQGLDVAERIEATSGQEISRKLPPETVGAVAVNLADSSSQVLNILSGELNWTAPAGKWEVKIVDHQFRTAVTRAVNNPTRGKDDTNSLCDFLNPAATRQFLEFTHVQYKKYLADEFGKTVLGFRGDEPDFGHMPWTPTILDEFKQRKGYDVQPYLASFFTPRLTEELQRVKADYWDVWSDLFGDNFFKVQADWCASNGVEYMTHLNNEHNMRRHIRSTGDFFKCMRHVQVPGVDAIWNQVWPGEVANFVKLASSASHLFGLPRALSESYAAYNPRPNVEQVQWGVNYQLVRGINLFEFMFYSSSAGGEVNLRGYMGADEFPAVAAYTNRASYLLSQGRPTAQIAVYFPTTSFWLGDWDSDESSWALAQQLHEHQRDFDFVDDQTLSSVLTLDRGMLRNLSGQSYRAVIIPSASAISKAVLERLRAFAASGGRVIFLGRQPSLVVEKTFLNAAGPADLGWAVREPSGELTPRVIEVLPQPDVMLDQPCPPVKYLHRRWRDADLYFFFNEGTEKQLRMAVLAGSGQAQVWDASSGRIESLSGVSSENNGVRLPLVLEPYEAKFILVGTLPPGLRPE